MFSKFILVGVLFPANILADISWIEGSEAKNRSRFMNFIQVYSDLDKLSFGILSINSLTFALGNMSNLFGFISLSKLDLNGPKTDHSYFDS